MKLKLVLPVVAFGVITAMPAFAEDPSELKALCIEMADEEGGTTEKTDTACGCLAEKIADNAELSDELVRASTLTPGDERDAAYSEDMYAAYEACHPWE